MDYACQRLLHVIEERLPDILDHFPSRPLRWVLTKSASCSRSPSHHGPDDLLGQAVASVLLAHSPARERLTAGIYVNREPADVSGRLEHAFDLIIPGRRHRGPHPVARPGQLGTASGREMWLAAERAQVIGDEEVATLEAADKAARAAIDVDDFAPENLAGHAAVELRVASTA